MTTTTPGAMKSILKYPEKTSRLYKGDEKRYSPIDKHPGIEALRLSIERGKEMIAKNKAVLEGGKK